MFTVQDVNGNFAKALDHLGATATPNDGGVTAATVQALRELVSSNPELQKQLTDNVNSKMQAVQAQAVEVSTQTPKTTASGRQGKASTGNNANANVAANAGSGDTGGDAGGDAGAGASNGSGGNG